MKEIQIIESKNFNLIAELIEDVQNLHSSLFPAIYKPFKVKEISEVMEQMLADDNCRLLIAQLNGESIAYLMLIIKEVPENAFHYSFRLIHIDQIAVSKKNQKIGVGSMLMEKAEMIAKELNIDRLELDHLDNNLVAADFFQSKGYIPFRSKLFKKLKWNSTK
ncbi:MAG: hypothetical protein RJA07_135 [Bacteroidota bacterium]|jgi:ribosomal protein S18 acetylase RimI-like enzyme